LPIDGDRGRSHFHPTIARDPPGWIRLSQIRRTLIAIYREPPYRISSHPIRQSNHAKAGNKIDSEPQSFVGKGETQDFLAVESGLRIDGLGFRTARFDRRKRFETFFHDRIGSEGKDAPSVEISCLRRALDTEEGYRHSDAPAC